VCAGRPHLAGNGSDELIALVLRATIDPGDRVAFPVRPTVSTRRRSPRRAARRVCVPFPEDFVAAPRRRRPRPAHLPLQPELALRHGRPLGEVEALARAVAGVSWSTRHTWTSARETALPLIGWLPNVIVLRTFSKSFSLAGLRVGWRSATPTCSPASAR